MKRILKWIIYAAVCFFQTCQINGLRPREGLCITAGLIISSSGSPTNYEMDEYDEIDTKYEMPHTTYRHLEKTTTNTTTNTTTVKYVNPNSEWRMKGEYRIQCVEDANVAPTKVINLLSDGNWEIEDKGLKRWVLCVMNKMNLMSKEGVFKMDVAMSKINVHDKDEVEAIIDYCLPTKPLHPAEIAWRYVKCHNSVGGNYTSISVF